MDLNELLQQAQRLTNEMKMDTELPRVDRTLSQVLQAAQELHSRITCSGTNDLQAHILLGSRGVDLPKLTQKLESLSASKSFEPLNPIADTDVEGFLKNERENAIIAVIEETNKYIFKSVARNTTRSVFAEWGQEKHRLLNALVGPNQEEFPDVHRQTVNTVLPQNAQPSSRLTLIESLYAVEISTYNQVPSINQGSQRTNLLSKLTQLAKDKFNSIDSRVHEMWSVLSYMANVLPLSRNTDPIKSRQTGPHFVQQALAYLEQCYKQYMNTVIQKNRLVGLRGGIPNVYNTVNSFVSITYQLPQSLVGLLDVSNGRPLWPLVYYSLRSGDYTAAVQFLKDGSVCPDLLKLLQYKQQQKMLKQQHLHQQIGDQEGPNVKLEGQLKLEYNNKLRVCTDPFKKAVYAIVLACDPHEPHQEVVRTIDDFLWMQLSVLSSDERPDYRVERLSYGGLQSLILDKYGEHYFNAREKAPLYFQVLVLTGQFESAIEFLARTAANRPHAVHMAIALNELSMLGTSNNVQEPLLSTDPDDPPPMRRLNLARLIILYTKCFEQTDTMEALQYYYLLRHFKAPDGRNLMLNCVSDLIVENCDEKILQLIFGLPALNDPSRYTGGMFAQFPGMDQDKYILAGMAADELSQRTKFELAIRLYLIAGQMEKALRLMCSLLAQVVHQTARAGSMREQLSLITERISLALVRTKMDVDDHVLATYNLLSQLLKFFDYYHSGESRLAAEILAKQRITPNNCDEVDACVKHLKMIGSDIVKVLPDVLLAAMNLIYAEYTELKADSPTNRFGLDDGNQSLDNKDEMRHRLRQRAKALTNMAATLPYRMPSDANNRLVQMEILMY